MLQISVEVPLVAFRQGARPNETSASHVLYIRRVVLLFSRLAVARCFSSVGRLYLSLTLSLPLSLFLFMCLTVAAAPYREQLSSTAGGEDVQSAESLCSASAIFLALYDDDQPAAAAAAVVAEAKKDRPDPDVGGGGSCCRLGDLLRQVC